MGIEKLSTLELVPMIVSAATSLMDRAGTEQTVDGLAGSFLRSTA